MPESKLSHRPKAQYGFVPKLNHHGGKYIALWAKKPCVINNSTTFTKTCFSVERSATMFLPQMMSYVAQQRVMMAGLVQELALKHRDLISTRKFEELRHR